MGDVPRAVRDRLLVEARHRCTICAEKCYEIHHVVEQKDDGGHEEENLIVLCPNCHQQRVHRNSEFTPGQLRMYKQGLKDNNEVEKRLLMDLEEIRRGLPDIAPTESERRLREVVEGAARVVSQDRSPQVVHAVAEVSNWLAERDLIKGGARRAIELDWEIARARERNRFLPPISVVRVDDEAWTKEPDFPAAYSIDFVLDRAPHHDWVKVFNNEFKVSFYSLKRRTRVRGDRVNLLVADSDNLQAHADFIKRLVDRTNQFIKNTVFPAIDKAVDAEKRQALHEFDTVRLLKTRTRAIKL